MSPTPPPARVTIEPAICIGSGNCVLLASGAIAMGEDGVARVVEVNPQDMAGLRLAERFCPTGAIFI